MLRIAPGLSATADTCYHYLQTSIVDLMLQSTDTSASCDVADTLSVLRRLVSLHRLEWTFNSEEIPLSRHVLSTEDLEQTGSSEEQQSEIVTVDELQSFLRRCIPEVDVQLTVCHLQRLVPGDNDHAGNYSTSGLGFDIITM